MSLDRYRSKRRFAETPEPEGESDADRGGLDAKPRFVIHKHDATRVHFDLRLEHNGVLKCWAVPRGPSVDPGNRRLAVATEDHPLEYLEFEGLIPAGNYGAGPMMIWDRGHWSSAQSIDQGFQRGELKITLHGERLQGDWALIRTGGEQSNQWLLIREKKDPRLSSTPRGRRRTEPAITDRTSIVSGRTFQKITEDAESGVEDVEPDERMSRPRTSRSRKAITLDELPRVSPMLPSRVELPPRGNNWIHELKLDGYRMQIRVAGGEVQLLTRNGIDWTDRLPELADAVASLPVDSAVLDGELVALAPDGSTHFSALQSAFREKRTGQLVLFVFDLLLLGGQSWMERPLLERKRKLEPLIRGAHLSRIQYLDHLTDSVEELLGQCRTRGLEGVVSKRGDKPYREGRTKNWVKVKVRRRARFVIGGFERSSDAVGGLGAIAVGYFRPDGELVACGKVGGGWNERDAGWLLPSLDSSVRTESPFAGPSDSSLTWVEPAVVVEVQFAGVSDDGQLRHATLHAIKAELPPESVTRSDVSIEVAEGDFVSSGDRTPAADQNNRGEGSDVVASGVGGESEIAANALAKVRITSPDRVAFPEDGFTKADVIAYMVQVSRWMLPHLENRPVTLVRCPQGIGQEHFFQRHHSVGMPASIRPVDDDGENEKLLAIDTTEGLVAAAQMNAIELHTWGCRLDRIDRPDRIVLDLDPDPALPWSDVVDAAWLLNEALKQRDLDAYVKTSGGKGLHLVVPIARRYSWQRVSQWCSDFAGAVVGRHPKRLVATSSKRLRTGKIYVDHLRNRKGSTAVAPYSLRARPGAPVSVPLAWDELAASRGADQWNIQSLPQRLRTLDGDPWSNLSKNHQRLK